MHSFIRRGLYGSLVAGGLIALGAGAASAADNHTSGRHGLLAGNQVVAHITAPVTVTGNAISVIGDSSSSRHQAPAAGTNASPTRTGSNTTSGRRGIGSGNQFVAHIRAPITISGNAISGVGNSSTTHQAGNNPGHPRSQTGAVSTSGRRGNGSGSQVIAPVFAPVTVGGNAASVVGDSSVVGAAPGSGGSTGGSTVGSPVTSGDRGVLSGNQVIAPVYAPVTVGGNAISVIGDSTVTNPRSTPGGDTPPMVTTPGDGSSSGSAAGPSAGSGSGSGGSVVTAASAIPAGLAMTGANMLLAPGIALPLLLFGSLMTGVGTTRRRVALLA